ncbi:MAG TPA: hypothetical protein VNR38_07575 [Ureibacillus sp.]|nr:hypothetical protein [Ureibacillus sp.]
MYYFNQPNNHYLPYRHTTYHTVPIYPSTNNSLLYQTAQRSGLPQVDSTFLNESAKESQKLMREASKLVDLFATSKDFSTKVMDAAQRSNNVEVQRLIQSNGITSKVGVYFNPDGIRLEFSSKVKQRDCCQLLVVLRWR